MSAPDVDTLPDPASTGPGRLLVVIGGLPGSGKTTLLRRLTAQAPPAVAALDSEDVAARVQRGLPWVPYRLIRPLVHLRHRFLVLRRVADDVDVVVLTDPWTRRWWRDEVLAAARRSHREVRLVLIDASPEAARAGQETRGRSISSRSMSRHASRWQALVGVGGALSGCDGIPVVRIDQEAARRLTWTEVLGAA